ncbi:MAG: prolipoprotein diacylglyceryl transferase [Chromatiales bacterium]|nr:prolipoprotein diacylglyceryl transferase [Chromatiales bacterium]
MYVLGFLAPVVLRRRAAPCRRTPAGRAEQTSSDLVFYGALGVILGGRLGYVLFYNPALLPRAPARGLRRSGRAACRFTAG